MTFNQRARKIRVTLRGVVAQMDEMRNSQTRGRRRRTPGVRRGGHESRMQQIAIWATTPRVGGTFSLDGWPAAVVSKT